VIQPDPPVAMPARSKAQVLGLSIYGIVGSNPAEGKDDVCLLCLLCVA
jgi:hypothetical protein